MGARSVVPATRPHNEGDKMTESPLKEKIKQSFIENDRLQEELSVAIDNWTASWDRGCKRIAKMCEEIK